MKVFGLVAWPFRSLKLTMVVSYNFVEGVCSSLKQEVQRELQDPIKIVEAVLEAIWMVVSPFIRAVIWLCEIIIKIKRCIEVGEGSTLSSFRIS